MPGDRVLWTGPFGAASREHALASASTDPSGLWLSASPMARDQLRRELAVRAGVGTGLIPRVWCWADLWARVRDEVDEGPSCLSEGGAGTVFDEAIRQARRADELSAIAGSIDWPGYRRQLRQKFAGWTIEERSTRDAPPAEPIAAAEWATFRRYRNLLRKLGAEDEPGLAAWASKRLLQRPPASLSTFAQVTFLDWESPSKAHWRVLDHALRRAPSVRVTLACEDGDSSASLYESTATARARLHKLGFVETPVRPEIWRPAGLRELERVLFRGEWHGLPGREEERHGQDARATPAPSGTAFQAVGIDHGQDARATTGPSGTAFQAVGIDHGQDARATPAPSGTAFQAVGIDHGQDARATSIVATAQGLTLRGAPQGEGVARVLAREVRDRLDRGADPEDILVLFRRWGEPADVALETLRDWGIPVHAEPRRPLGAEPSVAALLLAIGLPVEDWATDRVIRLLRNGKLRPGGPGSDPWSMAAAASVVKTASVFRGRESLLNWLDRTVAGAQAGTVKGDRARLARDLVERIFALLAPLDQPRPFVDQVDWLFYAAGELGIDAPDEAGHPPDGDSGLDRLRDALEDRAGVLESLGRGEAPWTWADFAAEVESFAMELTAPPPPTSPGSVRMAAVDDVAGVRAAHVILADLSEGTFPARDAVEAFLTIRPGVPPDAASRQAFSREMLRFLRVIGSAESSLVLIYPTTDHKGQELLRAGFLDELMEHLTPEALAACHRSVRRLDPAPSTRPSWPARRATAASARWHWRAPGASPRRWPTWPAAPAIAGRSTAPPPRSRCSPDGSAAPRSASTTACSRTATSCSTSPTHSPPSSSSAPASSRPTSAARSSSSANMC